MNWVRYIALCYMIIYTTGKNQSYQPLFIMPIIIIVMELKNIDNFS